MRGVDEILDDLADYAIETGDDESPLELLILIDAIMDAGPGGVIVVENEAKRRLARAIIRAFVPTKGLRRRRRIVVDREETAGANQLD